VCQCGVVVAVFNVIVAAANPKCFLFNNFERTWLNNNNDTQNDIYSAVIMTTWSLREFTRFI